MRPDATDVARSVVYVFLCIFVWGTLIELGITLGVVPSEFRLDYFAS